MNYNEPSTQKADVPKWATKITLGYLTLIVVGLSAISLLNLVMQIAQGKLTAFGLALSIISAAIALRLWQIWFRLRKTRSTWHTDL